MRVERKSEKGDRLTKIYLIFDINSNMNILMNIVHIGFHILLIPYMISLDVSLTKLIKEWMN